MPQEWRPSWSRYLGFARAGLIVVGLVLVGSIVTALVSTNALLAIAPLAVVVLTTGSIGFGSQALRILRTRLEIDSSWVTWRGVFGQRRLSRAGLRGALGLVKQPMTTPLLTLLATDGQQSFRLVAGLWQEADLVRIADQLQIVAEDDWRTMKEMEVIAPGTTTAIGRHPWRTGFLVALSIIVVDAVVATVLVLYIGTDGRAVQRGPAQVSQATVADQTATMKAVESALGSGWRAPRTALWTCGGFKGVSAGWSRNVQVIKDRHPTPVSKALPRLRAVLRQHHYTGLSLDDEGDTQVLNGVRESGSEGDVVEVQISATYASLDLTGPCEH